MIQKLPAHDGVRQLTFISDLHLFSSRSNADSHLALIARTVAEADLCIWGGDLFDFRWSRLRNQSHAIEQALAWLGDWYDRYPTTTFIFLNGNHDAHAAFTWQLREWAADRPRFTCGLDCLRVADTLFLHGDVIEGGGSSEGFSAYRQRWRDKPIAGEIHSQVYDMVVATRAHRAASLAAHRQRATCLRLLRWLHRQPEESIAGIARIVFGHTHRRIQGYRLQGIEFYNGGAAIRHLPFAPVQLLLDCHSDDAATR